MMISKILSNRISGFKRGAIVLLIAMSCVGCDQASKAVAHDALPRGERLSLFNDVLRLQYVENSGAFLGLGQALSVETRAIIFIGAVALLLLGLLIYLLVAADLRLSLLVGLSLIVGGGLSNLLDRLLADGVVIDFINLGVGSLRTGIFNLADVAIMTGTVLVIVLQRRRSQYSHS